MKQLTLYSRAGCHLCEVFLEDLLPLIRGRAEVAVIDIDEDTARRSIYDLRIPVLADGDDVVCEAVVEPRSVLDWLNNDGD